MKTDISESRTSPVLPRGVRVLAITTGLFTGFTFIAGGLPGLLLGLMLVVGAGVQPWTHRAGKWLLIAGAFSVTVLSGSLVVSASLHLRGLSTFDFHTIGLPLFLFVLTVLIVWCDVWLIVYATRSRHRFELSDQKDFLNPMIVAVWVTAAGASALFIPEGVRDCILLHRHTLGIDLSDIPFFVLPGLALAVLDAALLTQGIKELHAYVSHRHTIAA